MSDPPRHDARHRPHRRWRSPSWSSTCRPKSTACKSNHMDHRPKRANAHQVRRSSCRPDRAGCEKEDAGAQSRRDVSLSTCCPATFSFELPDGRSIFARATGRRPLAREESNGRNTEDPRRRQRLRSDRQEGGCRRCRQADMVQEFVRQTVPSSSALQEFRTWRPARGGGRWGIPCGLARGRQRRDASCRA